MSIRAFLSSLNDNKWNVLLTVLILSLAIFLTEADRRMRVETRLSWIASAAPDCQQYLDRAVKAATDIERGLGVSNRQVLALESMAWTAIYNACRGR